MQPSDFVTEPQTNSRCSTWRFRGSGRIGLFISLLVIGAAPHPSRSQSVPAPACRALIRPQPHDPLGPLSYQSRGDRCEGAFQPNVNSEIQVRSVTDGPALTAAPAQDVVELRWSPRAQNVQLEAVLVAPGAAWRMDASIAKPSGGFRWNVTQFRQWLQQTFGVRVSDLGFVAWGQAGRRTRIYVPVRLATTTAAAAYRLALMASEDFTRVVTTVVYESQTGVRKGLWRDRQEQGTRFPGNRPFVIEIPHEGLPPGVLEVEVRALGKGIVSRELTLLHD